jgi:ribosomal protein S27AE
MIVIAPRFDGRRSTIMDFPIRESCPRCGGLITLATIEAHPDRADQALHSYQCAKCGPVRPTIISLRPRNKPPDGNVKK